METEALPVIDGERVGVVRRGQIDFSIKRKYAELANKVSLV